MDQEQSRLGWLLLVLAAVVTLAAGAVSAAPRGARLDLSGQDLADELSQFVRVSGVELLFDRSLVAHRRGTAVHGILTPGQALSLLLRGSGLTFHETDDGAFVISAAPSRVTKAPSSRAPSKPADEVGAVAEILVFVIGYSTTPPIRPPSKSQTTPELIRTRRLICTGWA